MTNLQKRILVTEDDEILKDMLVMVLQDEDYQVDAAADGIEALNLMSANKYDLLATDLYMPNMNGSELITKCHKLYPEIKIILFSGGGKEIETAHGNKTIKFLGEDIKVNHFLEKPCNLNDIIAAVENVLCD